MLSELLSDHDVQLSVRQGQWSRWRADSLTLCNISSVTVWLLPTCSQQLGWEAHTNCSRTAAMLDCPFRRPIINLHSRLLFQSPCLLGSQAARNSQHPERDSRARIPEERGARSKRRWLVDAWMAYKSPFGHITRLSGDTASTLLWNRCMHWGLVAEH